MCVDGHWDDAVRIAERICAEVPDAPGGQAGRASKQTQCARSRNTAYDGRARFRAKAGDFDGAASDELRAQQAANDLLAAEAAMRAALVDVGTPSGAMDMQARAQIPLTRRLIALAKLRLDAYRAHSMPDSDDETATQAGLPLPPPP